MKKDIAKSPFPKAGTENGRVTMATVVTCDPMPSVGRERKAPPLEYDLEDIEEANRLDAALRRQHAS